MTSLDGERAAKLDAMVAAGERSRPLYDAVPDTVARLETLQGRHVQVRMQEFFAVYYTPAEYIHIL